MIKYITLIFAIVLGLTTYSQKNVTTFGVQLKPLVSNKFFDSGEQFAVADSYSLSLKPRVGFNFGMLMRKGFTDALSLEIGINMVRRNFQMTAIDSINNLNSEMRFSFVGYEIPVQGLFYVKLSKQLYMNAAGGVSFDFYPSSIYSLIPTQRVDTTKIDFEQTSLRNTWGQITVIANIGFEYRTKESGYFYIGTSLHRSFSDIAESTATYTVNNVADAITLPINGNYLTLDFRYFFYEPEEERRRK